MPPVFLATEMGSIQSFLQTLQFGTAEYGRIYIVVQSTIGTLVGTEQGGLYVLRCMCALCTGMPMSSHPCAVNRTHQINSVCYRSV